MNGEWPWGSNFRSRLNKMTFRLNITGILGNLNGHGGLRADLGRAARVCGRCYLPGFLRGEGERPSGLSKANTFLGMLRNSLPPKMPKGR